MIPSFPVVDANVIARAVEGDEVCRRALQVLKEHRVQLMIPAIVYAELARGEKSGGVDRLPSNIIQAAFDFDVGRALASHFPATVMKQHGSRAERVVWDFDAMIFATAIAHGADALVTDNFKDFDALLRKARDADKIAVKLVRPKDLADIADTLAVPNGQLDLLRG